MSPVIGGAGRTAGRGRDSSVVNASFRPTACFVVSARPLSAGSRSTSPWPLAPVWPSHCPCGSAGRRRAPRLARPLGHLIQCTPWFGNQFDVPMHQDEHASHVAHSSPRSRARCKPWSARRAFRRSPLNCSICRGITEPGEARSFLNPLLDEPARSRAAARRRRGGRLFAARPIADGQKIVVYGDYDVDGMSGTALLVGCLKLLVGRRQLLRPQPDRRRLWAERRGPAPVGRARLSGRGHGRLRHRQRRRGRAGRRTGAGVDHHRSSYAAALCCRRPRAIVHPAVGPVAYPFAGLCGAGVAFKLAWVLCQRANRSKRVSQPMRDFLLQALGAGGAGNRGRRGAAGRRKSGARPARVGKSESASRCRAWRR